MKQKNPHVFKTTVVDLTFLARTSQSEIDFIYAHIKNSICDKRI